MTTFLVVILELEADGENRRFSLLNYSSFETKRNRRFRKPKSGASDNFATLA
jgi:hypothetical protein